MNIQEDFNTTFIPAQNPGNVYESGSGGGVPAGFERSSGSFYNNIQHSKSLLFLNSIKLLCQKGRKNNSFTFMEQLYATILVLAVTNHNLILAADSRKTNIYQDGIGKGTLDKICQTNDYYYAVSGLHSDADGNFSMQTILHRTLLEYSDFDAAIKRIALTLTTELKNYFINLKKTSPVLFRQFQTYSYSGGEIVIAKRVNDIPTAYLLDYRIIDGSVIDVVMNTGKTDIKKIKNSEECFWRAIGNTAFLDKKMPTEKEMAANPIKKARWIIEEGIKMYPAFVGEPINILEMTEAWEQWV